MRRALFKLWFACREKIIRFLQNLKWLKSFSTSSRHEPSARNILILIFWYYYINYYPDKLITEDDVMHVQILDNMKLVSVCKTNSGRSVISCIEIDVCNRIFNSKRFEKYKINMLLYRTEVNMWFFEVFRCIQYFLDLDSRVCKNSL